MHDKPQIHYQVFAPHPALHEYVECIWILESEEDAVSRHLIVPDGKMELIFHYGTPYHKITSDGLVEKQGRSLFAGQLTSYVYLQETGLTGIVAARFREVGASRFFTMDFSTIAGAVPALVDLVGTEAKSIEDAILNANSRQSRVEVLQDYLLRRLHCGVPDSLVAAAIKLIHTQAPDEWRLAAIASEVGLSERQLERRFSRAVGVGPKMFARIARVQRFLKSAHLHRYTSLTQMGLACGYYDQSHFIRDFKAFSGVTPSELVQANSELSLKFAQT